MRNIQLIQTFFMYSFFLFQTKANGLMFHSQQFYGNIVWIISFSAIKMNHVKVKIHVSYFFLISQVQHFQRIYSIALYLMVLKKIEKNMDEISFYRNPQIRTCATCSSFTSAELWESVDVKNARLKPFSPFASIYLLNIKFTLFVQ